MILLGLLAAGCGKESEQTSGGIASELPARSEAQDDLAPSSSHSSGQDQPSPVSGEASETDTSSIESSLEKADELIESQQWDNAEKILSAILLVDAKNPSVIFRLATVKAAQEKLDLAIELLEAIPTDDWEAGLPALGQAADWCMAATRYDKAESKYRKILAIVPDSTRAHRQLAFLLNRQGRRHEAAVHVRELIRLGDIQQDELHSLVVLTDPMYDPPGSSSKDGVRLYSPIGSGGTARWQFNQRRYSESVESLRRDVEQQRLPASLVAFFGRAAVEAQDDDAFALFLSRAAPDVQACADSWAAIGTHLLARREFEQAIHALGQAVARDGTDLISIGRLRQALLSAEKPELAQKMEGRWNANREILRTNNKIPDGGAAAVDLMAEMADRLYREDRQLEAIAWKYIEGSIRGVPAEAFRQLQLQRSDLLKRGAGYPSVENQLAGLNLSDYPAPDWETLRAGVKPLGTPETPNANPAIAPISPVFENWSNQVGLQHTFRVGTKPQESGFAIYQFFGAAIACFDFDRDGAVDVYLGQGSADPPEFRSTRSNPLCRNVDGRFQEIGNHAIDGSQRYTTGITSGDWNQDGFADLVVSNIGQDYLLLNQGDGSFKPQTLPKGESLTRASASVALGDVTGDGLPDIFESAYVDDTQLTKKPSRNSAGAVTSALVPSQFTPAPDWLYENNGAGQPMLSRWAGNVTSGNGEGDGIDSQGTRAYDACALGVLITDIDGLPGNEIFVGNDMYPNQYWTRGRDGQWNEVAAIRGIGFSYTGRASASMGVALGDFDRNGRPDIHITNYQQEAANLYLQSDGAFQDRNLSYRLNEPSRNVLGFGSQAIDFDNDGWSDLAVTNGHVEDEAGRAHPFRQKPQLFRNVVGRFELTETQDPTHYWQSTHLGRAMATLDFDRDGRTDLMISHLESPTALLVNRTETNHHWIQLELVGTTSERDAIGASVAIRYGDNVQSGWVTAGDGYFCRNEPVLAFGVADAKRVDQIDVRWPDGAEQSFRDVAVDTRYQITQGFPKLFATP